MKKKIREHKAYIQNFLFFNLNIFSKFEKKKRMFSIPYSQTGYFSKLMIDCLSQDHRIKSLYYRFPKLENFKLQIEENATK